MIAPLRRGILVVLFFSGLVGCASTHTQTPPPSPTPHPTVFDIMDFGAIADGKTTNTQSIQKAIDACVAAGGGRVIIPQGTFLTGPISLGNGVDLHLEKGALLQFSRNFDDYPLVYENFMGKDTVQCRSPITAANLHDISITGPGAIDGGGDAWRPGKKWKFPDSVWNKLVQSGGVVDEKTGTWWPTQAAMDGDKGLTKLRDSDATPDIDDYNKYRDLLRPDLVTITNCSHVLLNGPTFRNSPFWNVHIQFSHDITVRNVLIFNDWWAQNGDGIGFDSCRDVLMEDSNVYAGDDNISCKSGKDAQGRLRHRPTENVLIRRCTSHWGHGGFTLGSETSGDIQHIEITDCSCDGNDIGLRFKSVRGRGGFVQDILVKNVTFSNIQKDAILFDMYYEDEKPTTTEPLSERTPVFRNFDLENISCTSAHQSILIRGLAEWPISQITFKNMKLVADVGANLNEARDIKFQNVQIEAKKGPAFTATNVTGLSFDHVDTHINPNVPATQPGEPAP